MIRVVPDTNIYISAVIFGGVPRRALQLGSAGSHRFCISAPILAEYQRVLIDRFKHTREEAEEAVQRLHQLCQLVVPAETITACSDRNDDMVLECAVAAKAKLIVTGDKALLRLDPFRGVRIVTPAQFLLDAAPAPYR